MKKLWRELRVGIICGLILTITLSGWLQAAILNNKKDAKKECKKPFLDAPEEWRAISEDPNHPDTMTTWRRADTLKLEFINP